MAMQFHKEIKVSTGEYTNQQGETKKRYTKIGALFMDSETGNMSAKLDVLPMPNADGEVWLKFFDKYDDNAQFGSQQYAQQSQAPFQPQQGAPIPQQPVKMTPPPVQPMQQQPMQPQQQGEIPF